MINRIQPQGAPHLYKTYSISAPLATHWRAATCVEVDCSHYLDGWVTTVDTSTELGRKQAAYIIGDTSRTHTATMIGAGMWEFCFGPGQKCFRSETHRAPLERDPIYRITDGDFRAYGYSRVVTDRAWVDDFGEHQERVAELHDRG